MQENDRGRRDEYYQKLKDDCRDSFYQEVYHKPGDPESVVYDPETRRTYMRKVLQYGSPAVYEYLRTHINAHIPRIYHWWQEESKPGTLVVLEEFINGKTLSEVLSSRCPPSSEIRRRWLLELCDALEFLHRADPQIIHRDVKGENILINDDGVLKLIDYDAAKVYHPEETRDTVLLGTDGSAAPEQYGFGQSDGRTDIFAVGRLIEQMFPGDPMLKPIAEKACRLDPKDRYQTIRELRRAVLMAGQTFSSSCAEKMPQEENISPEIPSSSPEAAPSLSSFTQTYQFSADRKNDRPVSCRPAPAQRNFVNVGPIPGFRSRTPWKMLIAVLGYAAIAVVSFTLTAPEDTAIELWRYRITGFIWLLLNVDLIFCWGPAVQMLPGVHSQSRFIRIVSKTLWSLAALLLVVVISLVIFPG